MKLLGWNDFKEIYELGIDESRAILPYLDEVISSPKKLMS